MPSYYFDIHDGSESFTDEHGQTLPNREDARNIALAMLPELIRAGDAGHDRREVRVDVPDDGGAVILVANLTVTAEWRD